ncbi:hypothetical protein [Kitasatospora sp. NPDC047058]|uniref:hypothetical protein n=1 Tax=Kitasatospora sp. NPDC047058 TaxID=3155620 RepID=UPI00340488E3
MRDRRTGRLGTYMATQGGEVYLRPSTGGTEWTTTPANVEPYGDEPTILVVSIPDSRYPTPEPDPAVAA